MPKAEWGVKRTCPNCEARFYDLQRQPILCPECGTTFAVDDHGKVSATRERRAPATVAKDEDALVDDEEIVEEDEGVDEPLLADDDEEDEPAGPALAEEDEEEQDGTVAFKDAALIEDDEIDDDVDEDEDEDDGEIDDIQDVADPEKGS